MNSIVITINIGLVDLANIGMALTDVFKKIAEKQCDILPRVVALPTSWHKVHELNGVCVLTNAEPNKPHSRIDTNR